MGGDDAGAAVGEPVGETGDSGLSSDDLDTFFSVSSVAGLKF
jgi:hypothetical protein